MKPNTPYQKQIYKDPLKSLEYALHFKGRFYAGEEAISKDGECAYIYALNILKGRFELAERKAFKQKKNGHWNVMYKCHVLQAIS